MRKGSQKVPGWELYMKHTKTHDIYHFTFQLLMKRNEGIRHWITIKLHHALCPASYYNFRKMQKEHNSHSGYSHSEQTPG